MGADAITTTPPNHCHLNNFQLYITIWYAYRTLSSFLALSRWIRQEEKLRGAGVNIFRCPIACESLVTCFISYFVNSNFSYWDIEMGLSLIGTQLFFRVHTNGFCSQAVVTYLAIACIWRDTWSCRVMLCSKFYHQISKFSNYGTIFTSSWSYGYSLFTEHFRIVSLSLIFY